MPLGKNENEETYSGNVLQDPLGSLSFTSTTLTGDDDALVALSKKQKGWR